MNCFFCNKEMKLGDLYEVYTYTFLHTKAIWFTCCICGHTLAQKLLTTGKNCDRHFSCPMCLHEGLDRQIQCKICPLFSRDPLKLTSSVNNSDIGFVFEKKIERMELVKMFEAFVKKTKTKIKLKLYCCSICGAALSILNSLPLEICGHYVCITHKFDKEDLKCKHRKCQTNRKPIIKVINKLQYLSKSLLLRCARLFIYFQYKYAPIV